MVRMHNKTHTQQLAIELYFLHNCTQGNTYKSYSECLRLAELQTQGEYYDEQDYPKAA